MSSVWAERVMLLCLLLVGFMLYIDDDRRN